MRETAAYRSRRSKTPQGGSPELEVPWRAGTRTRSAKRHELLKVLLPAISTPEATLLACDGLLSDGPEGTIQFKGQVNLYIEHTHSSTAVLPTHQMHCTLELWGVEHPTTVRPLIRMGPIDSGGVETLRDGIYCVRSGVVRLELFGPVGRAEPETPERLRDLETVTLKLELGVVGSRRPIRRNITLHSTFDRQMGVTMRVPLELKAPTTEDGEE
jgi:hypothetical protein